MFHNIYMLNKDTVSVYHCSGHKSRWNTHELFSCVDTWTIIVCVYISLSLTSEK